ncbi:unnamed protein product [Rhodiola kirilowii]
MNAKQDEMEAQLMEMRQTNQRMEAHNKMLENQITQRAESSTRALGKLPAQPEQGQKEYCNAIYI